MMNMKADFICIEILFNSVEAELVRRWSIHNVPEVFAHRPVDHIRILVKAWWHIYQESTCAGWAMNRTFWERPIDYPVYALGTPALVNTLQQIYELTDLKVLAGYRPLKDGEEDAICLLVYFREYYTDFFPEIVRSWLTNFAIFAPMEEQNLSPELTNGQLKIIAIQYEAILEKARQLLPNADQSLLAGTAGTVYLKQKGHRPLSEEDTENIIRALGTEEDKSVLTRFSHARVYLSTRLKKAKWIGLISEQTAIPYLKVRRRIAKPELWTSEEMVLLADVLQRLQL